MSLRTIRDGPWRLIEKGALVAALLLLVGGLATAFWSDRIYKQEKLDGVRVQAEILAASVSAALAFNDDDTARESVNALRANADIQSAAVYGADGALVASFARGPADAPPDRVTPGQPYVADTQIVVAVPVQQGQSVLGAVYLRSLTMSPAARMLRYGLIGLMAVLAALVVTVLAIAHSELRSANTDLNLRARDLAAANAALRVQIDERIRAEEALRQSQKMEAMGQLTGGVAHDFNNLLMAVASGLRLLERAEDPGRRAAITEGVQQAVDRGARLTRQLLAFARRQTLKPETVYPARQIAGMRELLERSLREDVRVEIDIPPDLWPISVDPGQLELVIINLAVNARDAMPNGGVLVISGRNVPADGGNGQDMVCLAVSDTGIGMPPDVVDRAFEPFFTTKEVHKGTGLGLSQVYGFTSQSNGSASIQSEVGKGSTVSLLLPRARAGAEAPAEPAPRERRTAPRPGPAMRVLMVEDDETVAEMVGALVEQIGHRCTHVSSASAALDALDNRGDFGGDFDLLFSDILMPGGMNGLELARTVRQRRPGLPIVLTTGYSETAHTVGAEFPILRKPYGPDDLHLAFEEARSSGAPARPGVRPPRSRD